MRVLLINPNSDDKCTDIIREKAVFYSRGRFDVDCIGLHHTPPLLSSYEDCGRAMPEMAEIVRSGQEDYDAFVIACFSDPNLDIMREISRRPVIGIAQAAFRFAQIYGERFGIISPNATSGNRKYALARKYFCQQQLKTVTVPSDHSRRGLLEAGRRAVGQGADTLLLGCALYAQDDLYLEMELGVPVLEGISCALSIAEGMVYRRGENTMPAADVQVRV